MPVSAARVSLAEVLEVRDQGLTEPELWSVLCVTCEALQDVCLKGDFRSSHGNLLPCLLSPFNIYVTRPGRIQLDLSQLPNDELFRPPESNLPPDADDADVEKFLIYSVGVTLEAARDFKVQKDPVSVDLSYILECMQEELPSDRIGLSQLLEHCAKLGKRYVGALSFSHHVMKLYRAVMGSASELDHLEQAFQSEVTKSPRNALMTRSLVLDSGALGLSASEDLMRSRKRRHGNGEGNHLLSPRSGISGPFSPELDSLAADHPDQLALHDGLLRSQAAAPGLAGALDRVRERRRRLAALQAAQTGRSETTAPSEDGGTTGGLTTPPSVHSFVHGSFKPGSSGGALRMGREGGPETTTVPELPSGEGKPPAYGRQTVNPNEAILRSKVRRETGDMSDLEFAVAYADGLIPPRNDGLQFKLDQVIRRRPRQNGHYAKRASTDESLIVARQANRNMTAAQRQSRNSQISIPHEERKFFGPEVVAMESLPPTQINIPDYVPKKGSALKQVRVQMLNGERLDVFCEGDTLGQHLMDAVLDHTAIPEHFYFGIAYMKDGEPYFIEADTKLHKVAPKEWREAGKNRHGTVLPIIFHTHLRTKFYPDCLHRVLNASTRHLLYLQLRKDVLEDRYPMRSDELLELCGVALQAEYGDHTPTRCGRGYCRAEHYLPGEPLRQLGLTAAEDRLIAEHKAQAGQNQAEAEVRYIEILQQRELYGVHLYKVSRDKNDRSGMLYLGINSTGIKIVEMRGSLQTVLLDYPWVNTEKISFNKRRFSILPKTDVKIGQKQLAKTSYSTSSYRKGRYLLRFCTEQHTFRLRHRNDWEGGSAGKDNPSYIHAEDVDDLESAGVRTVGGSGVRMRKVLPSPEDMNGAACGFQAEDIFVDYSTDEDADRDSEEIVSPRSRGREFCAPRGLGEFGDLESATRSQDFRLDLTDPDLLDGHNGRSARSAEKANAADPAMRSQLSLGPPGSELVPGSAARRSWSADIPRSFAEEEARRARGAAAAGGGGGGSSTSSGSDLSLSLAKDPSCGIGLTLVSDGPDVRVGRVLPRGPAQRDGRIRPGDVVLEVEGVPTKGGRHDRAQSLIEAAEGSVLLKLKRQRAERPARGAASSASALTAARDSPEGRGRSDTALSLIPPPPAFNSDSPPEPKPRLNRSSNSSVTPDVVGLAERQRSVASDMAASSESSLAIQELMDGPPRPGREIRVVLRRGAGPLGLNVTGGVNTSVRHGGIYVKTIVPGSAADSDGQVLIGDRVLSVDGVSLSNMTHRQAVELLRASGSCTSLHIWREFFDSHRASPSTDSGRSDVTEVTAEEVRMETIIAKYPLLEDQLHEAFMVTLHFPDMGPGNPPTLGLHLLDPMPADLAMEPAEQFVRVARHGDSCPQGLSDLVRRRDLLLEANDTPLSSTGDIRQHLWNCGLDNPLRLLIARPTFMEAEGAIIHSQLCTDGGQLGLTLAGSAEMTGGCYVRAVLPDMEILGGSLLRPGDKLLSANGEDMTQMSHKEATDFLLCCASPVEITALRPVRMSTDNDEEDLEDEEEEEEERPAVVNFEVPPSDSSASASMRVSCEKENESPPVPMRRRNLLGNVAVSPLDRPFSCNGKGPRTGGDQANDGSLTSRSSDYHIGPEAPAQATSSPGPRQHMRCKSEPIIDERDLKLSAASTPESVGSNKVLQPKTGVMRITLRKPEINSSLGFSIVTVDKNNIKGVFVKAIVKKGIADVDGRLRVGDRLLQISGESVIGLSNKKVVNMLKKPRTTVTLAISRPFAAIEGAGGTAASPTHPEWATESLPSGRNSSVRLSGDKSLTNSITSGSCVRQDICEIFREYGLPMNSDLDGLVASNMEYLNAAGATGSATPTGLTPTSSQAPIGEPDLVPARASRLMTQSQTSKVDLDALVKGNTKDTPPTPRSTCSSVSSGALGAGRELTPDRNGPRPPSMDSLQLFTPVRPEDFPDLEADVEEIGESPNDDLFENGQFPSPPPSITHLLLSDSALGHLTDDYVERLSVLQLPPSNRYYGGDLSELIKDVQEAMEEDTAGEEYKHLRMAKRKEEMDCECARLEENRTRNRYRNVLPYDSTRVRLKETPIGESDYINASHMRLRVGPRNLDIIASQGPLPSTVDHFWQMIIEQGVKVIGMVTQEVENGKIKCHVYWPTSRTEPLVTGRYNVTLEEEVALRSLCVRRFHVVEANSNRVVQRVFQLNYTAWPDQGIPDSASPLLRYIALLREVHSALPCPGPLLVHCSAGIGRTGALLTILYLVHALEVGLSYSATPPSEQELDADQFNISDTVRRLRSMRPGMIQTKDQYVFCYVALYELLAHIAQERTALL